TSGAPPTGRPRPRLSARPRRIDGVTERISLGKPVTPQGSRPPLRGHCVPRGRPGPRRSSEARLSHARWLGRLLVSFGAASAGALPRAGTPPAPHVLSRHRAH